MINVNVTRRPAIEIEYPLEDVIACPNEKVIFQCKILGFPQTFSAWYKNGIPIKSNWKIRTLWSQNWRRLEIDLVDESDHGVYTIVCSNCFIQKSSTASLFVTPETNTNGVLYAHASPRRPLEVVRHLLSVKVVVGQKIELVAYFRSDAIGDHVWYKNNEQLKDELPVLILSSNNLTTLSISKAAMTDSGVYFVVSKSYLGVASSFTTVQVTDVEEVSHETSHIPYIDEQLPEEVDANVDQEVRLKCKAVRNLNTKVQWFKNKSQISNVNEIAEDYGRDHVGLRITSPSISNSGTYTVEFSDEITGLADISTCLLTVSYPPVKKIEYVPLEIPLEPVVACVGSKVAFQCSFSLKDTKYFFVVWSVGQYKVERTNSEFIVICKGGNFLLYTKKLNLRMAGEVVCELHRSLPDQQSVVINKTTANLTIVPLCVINREYLTDPRVWKGKIYPELSSNQITPVRISAIYKGLNIEDIDPLAKSVPLKSGIEDEVILDITFCRMETSGSYFLAALGGENNIYAKHLVFREKPQQLGQEATSKSSLENTLVFEWDDCAFPNKWYGIDLGGEGSTFMEVGVSSLPKFEVRNPQCGRLMRFRVRVVEPTVDTSESNMSIGFLTRFSIELSNFSGDEASNGSSIYSGQDSSSILGVVTVEDGDWSYMHVYWWNALKIGTHWVHLFWLLPSPENMLKPATTYAIKPMKQFMWYYEETGDLIGEGAFGYVKLVRDSSGNLFAAKILKTKNRKRRRYALREFEIMKKLRHPRLVNLIDVFLAKDSFILVMDYLWGGELFDRIVDEENMKEGDVVPYVRQICEGLEYLHSLKIAHLDLKPENIICLSPNTGQVKIIDFGLAKTLVDNKGNHTIYGTKDYIAPEVLNYEALTVSCDMWSMGVVTYVLLSGLMPFDGATWYHRSTNITMANYNYNDIVFTDISDLAKDFINKLLLIRAPLRMSASSALQHPWIVMGPPLGANAAHMNRARENLKSYLVSYRTRWQRLSSASEMG